VNGIGPSLGFWEPRRAITRRLRAVQAGAVVTAWYDPRNPAEAVLVRAPNPIVLTISVALMCLAAVLWLASGPPRIRNARPGD